MFQHISVIVHGVEKYYGIPLVSIENLNVFILFELHQGCNFIRVNIPPQQLSFEFDYHNTLMFVLLTNISRKIFNKGLNLAY
jgi:hypothetical protein